ncbi:MAG TPA: glycosyltransferase WbuB [Gammaproteobacteria bacterium]|nr:glycosyltransferase WbuB [Gammaproteobacteria bacterium]
MRILILEAYYEPDGGPAAPLYTMLCQELVRRGHHVTVLTAVPHYPSGQVPAGFRKAKIRWTVETGVQVARVPLPSVNRSKLACRLWQFAVYQLGAVLAGWRLDFDVFISATPSLEVWLPFHFFSIVRNKPAVYSVHDVYPDTGIQLGIFRHKPVIRLVTALERSCVKRAAVVRVLSQSFVPRVKRLGVSEERIRLIYDWVDTNLIVPLPKSNPFAVEHGLDNKFVVLYAGNVGFSQGLEYLLDTACLLSDEHIHFLVVGEGAAKEDLLAKANASHLQNVTFLPFQPRERLPEVLASADVSVVMLRRGMGFNSLPSKTLSILASGRPIIVSIDEGSDTWNLVERSGAGICVPPESPERLAEAIKTLKQNPALGEQMGQNGRRYALLHHSPESAAEAFESLLLEVTTQ